MTEQSARERKKAVTMAVAGVIAIALTIYMITFQVRATEVAVVTTFGKVTRSIEAPGLYWKWPFPVQYVRKFDRRIQEFESRLEQVFTADEKNIIISTYIGWRVKDPVTFMRAVTDVTALETTLEASVRSYVNGVISQHDFSDLISERTETLHFKAIEDKVVKLLNDGESHKGDVNKGVKEEFGIEIVIFGLKKLELPEKTTQEVFNRMQAERQRIAEEFRSKGKSEGKKIKTQADSEAKAMKDRAVAEAKIIRGQGDSKAAEHYRVFAQNKELAIWLFKLETLEKLLNEKTTLVLDTRTPPFDMLSGQIKFRPEGQHPTDTEQKIPGEEQSQDQKSETQEQSEGKDQDQKQSQESGPGEEDAPDRPLHKEGIEDGSQREEATTDDQGDVQK